jgi:hypothetical protein
MMAPSVLPADPAGHRKKWMRTMRQLFLSLCTIGLASVSHAGISGVCPDGSIYIVQNAAQIPCTESKQVEPSQIPPMRPEYLPSPYTWQVWNERHNPNNPYNVIDDAQQVRGYELPPQQGDGSGAVPPGPAPEGQSYAAASPNGQRPAPVAPRETVGPLDLGLSDQELQNLFTIIDLSQQQVPARLQRRTADGAGVFEVTLARSRGFEGRLQHAWRSRGGIGAQPVLLFTANSKRPEAFWANLTFVQGHLTYQPDAENPRQLGVLQGRLGELESGEVVLGYVILPESWDLSQELDVYWNDRHLAVTFGG